MGCWDEPDQDHWMWQVSAVCLGLLMSFIAGCAWTVTHYEQQDFSEYPRVKQMELCAKFLSVLKEENHK